MRKHDITRLVAIQGFSVDRIEFSKESVEVETREKQIKFYRRRGRRSKVRRKVPKKDRVSIPRVDIYLKRDEAVYRCSGCGRQYHSYDHFRAVHRERPTVR